GIDIGVHYTWLFIFILFSWALAAAVFPTQHPGWTTATYWIAGIVTTVVLFISVLLHELAHSLVAQSRGMKVSSITLFIFGGVSNLEEEPQTAWTEFSMAIVGPLTSAVLGGIFWGITFALTGHSISFADLLNGTYQNTALQAVIGYLGWINILLAIFNILPAFPLDGGRVLRSIIWGGSGNLVSSTNAASAVGQIFGWAFIILGIFMIFGFTFGPLGGGLFGGLWIAFIGWFLQSAAGASRRELTLREHLSGIKVKEVMSTQPGSISPDTSVQDIVNNIFQRLHGRAVPVCANDKVQGIVTIDDVKKVPRDQWSVTRAERIMTTSPLYTVKPEDGLNEAFKLIGQHNINQVLVTEDGKCMGMLSRADIIAHLQLHQDLGIGKKPTN
ncbi:MAG TPA: site-2 protease family protein, partial [Dehalococcoidales bacterium]|nr:site-2 protease family protein [Dehalococcoidales bacterium]